MYVDYTVILCTLKYAERLGYAVRKLSLSLQQQPGVEVSYTCLTCKACSALFLILGFGLGPDFPHYSVWASPHLSWVNAVLGYVKDCRLKRIEGFDEKILSEDGKDIL